MPEGGCPTAQGEGEAEEEEEAGGQRKGGLTGIHRQAQTLPHIQFGQGSRMRGTGENMNGGVGFHSTGGAEGPRDQSYPLTIGIEGATER